MKEDKNMVGVSFLGGPNNRISHSLIDIKDGSCKEVTGKPFPGPENMIDFIKSSKISVKDLAKLAYVEIKDSSIEEKLMNKCDYLSDGIKNTKHIEALDLIEKEHAPNKTRRGKLNGIFSDETARDIEKNPSKYDGWIL